MLIVTDLDLPFLEEYDCFALLVLSFGTEDGVLGSDNKEITYKELIVMLEADKVPPLIDKPKLIFF